MKAVALTTGFSTILHMLDSIRKLALLCCAISAEALSSASCKKASLHIHDAPEHRSAYSVLIELFPCINSVFVIVKQPLLRLGCIGLCMRSQFWF